MFFQKALIIVFLLTSPTLALAFAYVKAITIAEAVRLQASQSGRWPSPDDIRGFTLGPKYIEHLKWQFNQLADKSLPVLQICVNDLEKMCQAPQLRPYPLFPLSESARNTILGRPSPDVVQNKIEQATNGELSTVGEIVEKLNANIRNSSAMSDDEMMLLASNFHHSKAGWTVDKDCHVWDGGAWSQDVLISEDEQRALTAGFLYVYRNQGYRDRREDALREEIRRYVKERLERPQKDCKKDTDVVLQLFIERVTRLEDEAVNTGDEWLARYERYLAALRVGLQDIASFRLRESPHTIGPLMENLVAAAEDAVNRVICDHVPLTEAGFLRFVAEPEANIQRKSVQKAIQYKLAYFRWKALSVEDKAHYIKLDALELNVE